MKFRVQWYNLATVLLTIAVVCQAASIQRLRREVQIENGDAQVQSWDPTLESAVEEGGDEATREKRKIKLALLGKGAAAAAAAAGTAVAGAKAAVAKAAVAGAKTALIGGASAALLGLVFGVQNHGYHYGTTATTTVGTTTTDDTPIFDRNRVSLAIPDELFGSGFTLITNISQIVGNVIMGTARRTKDLLDGIRPTAAKILTWKGVEVKTPGDYGQPAPSNNNIRR